MCNPHLVDDTIDYDDDHECGEKYFTINTTIMMTGQRKMVNNDKEIMVHNNLTISE